MCHLRDTYTRKRKPDSWAPPLFTSSSWVEKGISSKGSTKNYSDGGSTATTPCNMEWSIPALGKASMVPWGPATTVGSEFPFICGSKIWTRRWPRRRSSAAKSSCRQARSRAVLSWQCLLTPLATSLAFYSESRAVNDTAKFIQCGWQRFRDSKEANLARPHPEHSCRTLPFCRWSHEARAAARGRSGHLAAGLCGIRDPGYRRHAPGLYAALRRAAHLQPWRSVAHRLSRRRRRE